MLQIGMIVIVLMGTIGIPFYQHTCLSENQVHKSIFVPMHDCAKEHAAVEVPDCCAAKTTQALVSSQETAKDNCCLDEVSNWQVSFFFFQDVHPIFSGTLEELKILSFFTHFETIWADEDRELFSGSDPPTVLKALERLTHLCIWRL